jgi:hypothetical protein
MVVATMARDTGSREPEEHSIKSLGRAKVSDTDGKVSDADGKVSDASERVSDAATKITRCVVEGLRRVVPASRADGRGLRRGPETQCCAKSGQLVQTKRA